MRRNLGAGLALLIIGLIMGWATIAVAAPADEFAARLQAAMMDGAVAYDRLWADGARSAEAREIDARSQALFRWSDVTVVVEETVPGASDDRRTVIVQITGTARWNDRAWGVADALWTLQTDEDREVNRVVRREAWEIERQGDEWLAVGRERLSPLQIVDAEVDVAVYPGQDAMLLECTWYVRSLVDGVENVRFLVDRPVHIYDFRVNGLLAKLVRGSELGALGLEGWSPEAESSFRFPEPLAAGEEAAIRFRARAPLAHMRDGDRLTTLPIQEGPFEERAWVPVLPRSGVGKPGATGMTVRLRWPREAFAWAEVAAPPDASVERIESGITEEDGLQLTWEGGRLDALDFSVASTNPSPGVPGVLPAGQLPLAYHSLLRGGEPRYGWRSPQRVLLPIFGAARASRDLESELQDLLPLDDELLDELFDESSGDAERGADDRSAGG